MKNSLTIVGLLLSVILPYNATAQRLQQKLGHSVVAVTDGSKDDVLVTWRKLAQEPEKCKYNLYKRVYGSTEYTKVNSEPIDRTNFQTTRSVIPYGSELAVTTVYDNKESAKSNPFLFKKQAWKDLFFDFDFETRVLNPANYRVKYAWPMDINGDGEFDAVVVDRLHTTSGEADPDYGGVPATTSHKIQAYKLDGTCLWTVDLGPNVNISAGQNDMVLAYDINCDGKCEVIIKSSDGTRFWDSRNDTWGKYANGSDTPDTDGDGLVDYRPSGKYIPPYYISVIDGATGEEIDCSELDYSAINDGVDKYSRDNRAEYMNDGEGTEYAFLGGKFAICYFDGIHPSLAIQCYNRSRNTGHHYYVLEWKYNWQGGKASGWHHEYTWPMKSANPPAAEFHQFRVADVDGDGIDEIMEGGYAVNPTKGLVMSPAIGHGDRFDVTDIDPDRPGMEVFAIQQSNLCGAYLYDAATGNHIKEWYMSSAGDVGRGRCIDVDPEHKGLESFSFVDNKKLYDCKGNVIRSGVENDYPVEATWWDGDLQRELLASPGGSGYKTNINVHKFGGKRLIEFSKQSDWVVHAGTGVRPMYMGDMTGDWREEVILAKQSSDKSTGLVGYSTDIPTDYSMYTLQEDPHYRLDCTTRGYYQMPCTGFYLGGDMPYPPLPPTMVTDLRWQGGASWSRQGAGFATYDHTMACNFVDGKSVVFDMSGDNSQTIHIDGTVSPSMVYVMPPKGHDYSFSGGTLTGTKELWKSMQGKATFDSDFAFAGATVISEGILCLNGNVAGPVDLRAKGTLAGTGTIGGGITFEGALNYEGCRLMPGSATDKYGTLTFGKSLTLPGNVYIEVNAGGSKAGKLYVDGDLTFEGVNTFTIVSQEEILAEGLYVLAECSGKLTAEASMIASRGLEGINYDITTEGNRIILVVHGMRAPRKDVEWTGAENGVWDYKTDNFVAGNGVTTFVNGDEVEFGNASSNRNITLETHVSPAGLTFNFDGSPYILSGNGSITGSAGLIKNGNGELIMNLQNNDYTGPTIINGGTVTIGNMSVGGSKSSLGAAEAVAGNLVINGAKLNVDADNVATDRIITVSDTATVGVVNSGGSLVFNGQVQGNGYLLKDGPGRLTLRYAGENEFAGLVVKSGTVVQGSYRTTFGKSGAPLTLAGGTLQMAGNSSMSTMPKFNYAFNIVEGTESWIKGTERGCIEGTFEGKGSVSISLTGGRSEIDADFSAFAGTMTACGEGFHLNSNVTDMSKTRLVLGDGAKVQHVRRGGDAAEAITTKVGSVESETGNCSLGNGVDSYEVGYSGKDTKYSGRLTAKNVTKKGGGVWILDGSGSSAHVTVSEGTIQFNNAATGIYTSGIVEAAGNGIIAGTGCLGTVNVRKGGVLSVGNNGTCGTLKVQGNVTMFTGSTLMIRIGANQWGATSSDKFQFTGTRVAHSNDTILISVEPGRLLKAGDKFTVFTGTAKHEGKYTLKTVSGEQTIVWDDSRLFSEGMIEVASVTGVHRVISDEAKVDVYTTNGILLRSGIERSKALDGLASGIYIVSGEKIVKK